MARQFEEAAVSCMRCTGKRKAFDHEGGSKDSGSGAVELSSNISGGEDRRLKSFAFFRDFQDAERIAGNPKSNMEVSSEQQVLSGNVSGFKGVITHDISTITAQHGAAYELFAGEGGVAPVYVVGCQDASDGVFQRATYLLQERLQEIDETISNVQYTIYSMTACNTARECFDIVELINKREIFKEYQHITVAMVRGRGETEYTMAVGVGTTARKRQRAANLALAVALVLKWDSCSADTWINQNGITIFNDPLHSARSCCRGVAARIPFSHKRFRKELAELMSGTYVEPPTPWSLVYDFGQGAHYYWNPDTQEVAWGAPQGSQPARGYT